MNDNPPELVSVEVIDLVGEYIDACEKGQEPTLEELCAGRPELRKPVAYAIADSRRARQALSGDGRPPPPPATGVRERFSILEFVDQGGMGEVYQAADREAHRRVAYKVVHPRNDCRLFREYLLNEARLTAALAHPAIVPVFGVVRDDCGRPAYAMEFLAGETLHDAIARRRATPNAVTVPSIRTLLGHVVAVCRAVGYAHANGITHGDIKANNVRIRADGKPFVIDWGLARRHPDGVPPPAVATDVERLAKLLDHVLGEVGVPPALAATRSAALVERYATADALGDAVQEWLDTGGTPDYRDYWTVRAVRWANRRKATATAIAATVVLTLAAATAGVWYHFDSERKRLVLESAARETASNREWALHQEGVTLQNDAIRWVAMASPQAKSLGVDKIRTAIDRFAALRAEYPDEPAHRYRLAESRFIHGVILMWSNRPADVLTEVRDANAIFSTLSERRPSSRREFRLGDGQTCMFQNCRLLQAYALVQLNQNLEAFLLADALIRELAIPVPPLEKPFNPHARQMEALRQIGKWVQPLPPAPGTQPRSEDVLLCRELALMRLEAESAHMPHLRGNSPDHARGMRVAMLLVNAARVSDPAVYNAACTFALAAAELGLHANECERRSVTAVGYLQRLVQSGYFLGTKQMTELLNDKDFTPLRDREDFRAVVAAARERWARAAATGGGLVGDGAR